MVQNNSKLRDEAVQVYSEVMKQRGLDHPTSSMVFESQIDGMIQSGQAHAVKQMVDELKRMVPEAGSVEKSPKGHAKVVRHGRRRRVHAKRR